MSNSSEHPGEHTHVDEHGNVYTHTHAEEHDGVHTHIDEHGSVYTHTHVDAEGHVHTHTHDPAHIKRIINRLARSIGHLEAVKRMVERGEDCPDVLIQLSAVRSELGGTGRMLLKEHMEHCIVEAVQEHDEEAVSRMNRAIDQFMK